MSPDMLGTEPGCVNRRYETGSRHGVLFVYGNLSGQATPFPWQTASMKALSFRGYVLTEVTGNPERLARAETFITRGLTAGQLKPIIAKTFSFDQIVEAHRYLESNQQFGKIVVEISR